MTLSQAIAVLKSFNITVTRPFVGVWFCNNFQVTESEMIKWATIIKSRQLLVGEQYETR